MNDWKGLLNEAASEAMKAVGVTAKSGKRAKKVGVGAAGDSTLVADREAEKAIMDVLLRRDDVRILSEEAGEIGDKHSRFLAIVDPLDGSSNFSRGIPFYCSSICIVEGTRLGQAKYAMVKDLVTGDVYFAERGMGASKNGAVLQPSTTREITEAVAAVDLSRASLSVVESLGQLSSKVSRQVHFGANALEICMVADGQVDAFVDLRDKMRITDAAGAYLISKEAGVVITSEAGDELDPILDLQSRISLIASSNRDLHSKILTELGSFRERTL